MGIENFYDIIVKNVELNQFKLFVKFINFEKEKEIDLSYVQLNKRSTEIAGYLLSKGLNKGDRCILLLEPGIDYITSFVGCLYAGIIAIPLYPPSNSSQVETVRNVINIAQPQMILTNRFIKKNLFKLNLSLLAKNIINSVSFRSRQKIILYSNENIEVVDVNNISSSFSDRFAPVSIKRDDIAMLQFTSGSTSTPKGVKISHKNLIDNTRRIKNNFGVSKHSISVSWLPPYHDMGLIGNLLEALYLGATCINFSPLEFIVKPLRWLELISKFKADVSCAPNFAYELCVKYANTDLVNNLDLSSWEVALTGAEPINPQTLKRFAEIYFRANFKRSSFKAGYGLAESTIFVTATSREQNVKILRIDKEQYFKGLVKEEQLTSSDLQLEVVSCGNPGVPLKIVNYHTLQVAGPDEVGEIWIPENDSVTSGYFNDEDNTKKLFGSLRNNSENGAISSYLRTGDLGFMHQGELFVCGRLKNIIIIHGKNYYPHDIELAVASSDKWVRTGCVVAYATTNEGVEGLAVAVELQKNTFKEDYPIIVDNIQKIIARQFQLAVREIFLVPAHSIPKTTSGKLQRIKCAELVRNGAIKPLFQYVHSIKKAYGNASNEDWVLTLKNTPKKEYQQFFTTHIRKLIAEVLNIPDDQPIDLNKGFFDLGMDSLMTVDFKTQLADKLTLSTMVTKAVSFGYLNVATMIKFLAKNWSLEQAHVDTKNLIKPSSTIEIENNESKACVLLIHGLSSSPLEMVSCADALYQAGFSVRIPHYKTFGFDPSSTKKGVCASRKAWTEEVLSEFKQMQQEYEQIFVVGMCLGSILALELADNVGEQIQGLALLSTPFFYDGWAIPWYRFMIPIIGKTPLKNFISYKERWPYGVKNENIRTLIKSSMEINKISAAGSQKISLFGIHEAYLLTQEVKKNISQINISMLVIHAEEDETASLSNINYIQDNIQAPKKQVIILKDSYHMITLDNERHIVAQKITDFFSSLLAP
jgi:acyl-CoA synthetase (AMP-forming)/AMP-acid ligase II/esterase/lipase/acyl carrier protein